MSRASKIKCYLVHRDEMVFCVNCDRHCHGTAVFIEYADGSESETYCTESCCEKAIVRTA